MRRPAVLLLALLGALTSCAVLLGPDIAATQAVVDRVLPGRFLVVSDAVADSGGYHRVVLAPLTDPDARLTVIFRPEPVEDCGPGSGCETAVRSAVATAEEEAVEARTAVTAFTACGYPPVALSPVVVYPTSVQFTITVGAVVDDGTVERVTTDLDRCVDGWAAARADGASPWRDRQVGLRIEVVDRVGDPDGTAALPESMDLAGSTATVVVTDGRPDPVVLRPLLPPDAQAEFDGRAEEAAARWVVEQGLAAGPPEQLTAAGSVAVEYPLNYWPRHTSGSVERVRVYVGFCVDGPVTGCPVATAVALTVDRDGGAAGDLALIPLTEADGLLQAPEEPGLR